MLDTTKRNVDTPSRYTSARLMGQHDLTSYGVRVCYLLRKYHPELGKLTILEVYITKSDLITLSM